MKKVVHLTSVHTRYDVRIFLKECQSLAKYYQVNLVVADGKGNEIKEGVAIYDVGKPKNRFERIFLTVRKIYAKALSLQADIYHFHDPELMPIALKLKKKGKKVIYDMHEWNQMLIAKKYWIPFPLRKIISTAFKQYENRGCRKFDYVLVPQQAMASVFQKTNPNTEVIANFVILNEKMAFNTDKPRNVLFYPGAIGAERGLFYMLDALGKVKEDVTLLLAGPLPKRDEFELAKKHPAWKRVVYLGVISHNEVQKYYETSGLGIILYKNMHQYYMSHAVKLFEYMEYSIPIIMPNFGEWVKFNQENDCGISVDPSNSDEVAKAISLLINDPALANRLAKNGYCNVHQKYSWENEATKLVSIYKKLANLR